MEEDLIQLTPSPLRPIKQVELWKKWALLLPEYARAITCPKPTDEVIALIKKSKRDKLRKKTEDKNKQKEDVNNSLIIAENIEKKNSLIIAENIEFNF